MTDQWTEPLKRASVLGSTFVPRFHTLTVYCCHLGLFARNDLMSIELEMKLQMFGSIRHMNNSNIWESGRNEKLSIVLVIGSDKVDLCIF